MEVHMPDHPLHSWRDFWVHLGTITVGLLIALGLEGIAVHLHHLQQRSEILQNLEREGHTNRAVVAGDLKELDKLEAWSKDSLAALNGANLVDGYASVPLHPHREMGLFLDPFSNVWDTAKSSATVDLLPRSKAEAYSLLYLQDEWLRPVGLRMFTLFSEMDTAATEMGLADGRPAHLNAAQVTRLQDMHRRLLAIIAQERMTLKFYDVVNKAILDGATSQQEVVEKLRVPHAFAD